MFRMLLVGIAACLFTVFIYTLGLVTYNLFFHPLRAYPGPKSWAASRMPYTRSQLAGTFHNDITDLHKKYGDVVRIQPDELSYTNGAAWKDIYGHRQGHAEFAKDPLTQAMPVNGVPSIISANRDDHARYRSLLSHAFSSAGLRDQEPLIQNYVNLLIRRLSEHSWAGPTDMVAWYNFTTFDLIGDLAFGESFHCLENSKTHPWIAFIYGNIKAIPYMELFRRYGLTTLAQLSLPKSLAEARQRNYEYARDKIGSRIELGKDRGDFLDHVLKYDFPKGMNREELNSNTSTLAIAGSETTATLLSGATYYLLRNPEVLSKLTDEIRNTFASDKDIDIRTASQLKYLEAVLEEALRMYPPVTQGRIRIVPQGGDTVLGQHIPAGTLVTVQHYATYRSPNNFHKPDCFIPERWLAERDTVFEKDNRASLQPFSAGPRNCIGRNLAYVEMRLIMAKLLFNFDLELDEAQTGDWANQRAFLFWEKKPLWVTLKPYPSLKQEASTA